VKRRIARYVNKTIGGLEETTGVMTEMRHVRFTGLRNYIGAAGLAGAVSFTFISFCSFRPYFLLNKTLGEGSPRLEAYIMLIVIPVACMFLVGVAIGKAVAKNYKRFLLRRDKYGEEYYWGTIAGIVITFPSALLIGMFFTFLSIFLSMLFTNYVNLEALFSWRSYPDAVQLVFGIITFGIVSLMLTKLGAFTGGLAGLALKRIIICAKACIPSMRRGDI
jgi:hypothetical protein